jgi:hypothetical protein
MDDVVLWTDPTPFPPRTFVQPSFRPTINTAGRVAFVLADNNLGGGVYYWDGGEPQVVAAMPFTDVPGGDPGDKFSGIGPPALNEAGTIAFHASGPDGFGLFRFDYNGSGLLERLVSNGELAPGTGGDRFNNPFGPLLNDRGLVAFSSRLEGGRRGIWAFGEDGLLRRVALEQMAFDHDNLPGTPRRFIESVSLITDSQDPRSPSDGTGTAFNFENELAFSLRFTAASGGGAGVYVVDVDRLSIPEPASWFAAIWVVAASWRGAQRSYRRTAS